MSELNLSVSVAPELPTLVPGGAEGATRPKAGNPANAGTADNPFAALFSAYLQGTQPQAQTTGPVQPSPGLPLTVDEQADADTGVGEILALPGSAIPLPAIPATDADATYSTGKTLPVTGNPLPLGLTTAPDSGPISDGESAPGFHTQDPAAAPVAAASAGADGRPRISLADLALSRPLDAQRMAEAVAEPPTGPSTVQLLAVRAFQQKGTGTDQPADATRPPPQLSVTGSLSSMTSAVPVPIGADELAVRLNLSDLQRGTTISDAGANFVASQVATFAGGSDAGSPPGATGALTGSGGNDTTSSALLSRLGSNTLPALQPLASSQSFASGLADRLLTIGGPGTHTARLQLHPEHLGELRVEIQIDDGSAQVWFGTTTSQARSAIEASLPQLRELFADQGLALTRTQVDSGSSQTANQSFNQQQGMASGRPFEADEGWRNSTRSGPPPLAALLPAARASNRLVDAWA